MERLFFTKMTGAGNDFLLFDRKLNPNLNLDPGKIKKLCDRHYGVGADGILVFSDSDGHSFVLDYFNADGSTGCLCANGARCSIFYAAQSGRLKNGKLAGFLANGIHYTGEVLCDGKIKFNLNPPKKLKLNFKIKVDDQLVNASYIDLGSPHVVIKVGDLLKNPAEPYSFYSNLNELPVFELGSKIRHLPYFAPEGVNVNFIDLTDGKIFIRTFERGVENETLACGSGSVSAALISFLNYNILPPLQIITRSKEILIVDFKVENQKISDLSLTGPANVVFNGEINI